MYRWEAVHVFTYAYPAYFLMQALPRPQQHKAVMVYLLGYLSW